MKHPFLLLFVAALCGSLACAANTMVNFGFPRYPERDGVDWLAGMQVAINEANERGMVPGYNFSLVLATIPACTSSDFYVCMAQAEAAGADFLGNMSSMSAVLTPDWWITESVMAAARPLNMPVISPKTFGHTDTEQAIFLNQRIDSDIPHTLAYMFGAHECARTGLIMTKYLITFDKVYDIQRSFKYGGYPTPPMILTNATNAEMLHFILGDDPDRLCFVMQVTIDELYVIMDLLRNDARFSTEKYSFFSVGGMETTTYSSGGNTMVYDSLYITRHVPSFRSNTSATREFLAAFDLWTASSARDRDILTYLPGDVAPTQPSETAFFTYLATRYLVELVRIASLSHRHLGTLPSPSELLEVAYNVRTYVGGIVYQPLIRRCPDEPLPQVCFCNVAARTTYTFKVNGTTGRPYQVHDDASIGEVGVATTVLSADVCSPPTIDNANYPITISLIIPSDGIYVEMVKGISRVLGGIVSALNTITPAPSRPFRIYRTEATLAEITNEFQETISRQVQPFITLLNMGGSLNVSSTLLVYPNADIQPLEDRPLRKYQYGDENLLATIPSGADSLHTLVSYYSQSPPGKFTGISAFATTEAEAAVMRKSLHTFQIDIPIVVVTDASLFVSTLVGLTSASSNQFVLVCAINNNPLVAAIIAARNQHAGGVIAVATWEGALTQVPDFDTIIGDVLFTSFITEWWTPTSSIRRFINNSGSKSPYEGNDPALYMSAITFGFSYLIAQQATAASSSAASLLYQIGTVSVADVTFGPYSNASCTDKQIAENDRDRSCQCYKGPRTFYVHSLMDLNDKTESQRTGRYRYSITTCGVVYHPYIPPPDLSSSMSDGLVAGIIVAAVVLIIIAVVGALLSVLCFFGKKNRYAPKDSSKPFAMVFTDI